VRARTTFISCLVLALATVVAGRARATPLSFDLPNGFTAHLLPEAPDGLVHTALLLSAGWADEDSAAPRAAELVACAIVGGSGFEDAVRRVGGTAAYTVTPRETVIRVTAPIIKGPWVLNELAQLAFREPLREAAVRRCWDKRAKLPGGLRQRTLQLWNVVDPAGWQRRDYLETVLGYRRLDFAPTRPAVEALERWREEHYRTDGATLLCAGAFKEALFGGFVRDTFSRIAPRLAIGERASPLPLSQATFRRASVSPEDARLRLGVHFAALGPEDETALRLYARAVVDATSGTSAAVVDRTLGLSVDEYLDPSGVGYVALAAVVPPEGFPRAAERLADFVGGTSIATVLEDEAFRALRKSWLEGRRSLEFALEETRFRRRHGKSLSLEKTLLALDPAQARERARRVLASSPRFDDVAAPPTFFEGERGLLCALAAMATVLFLRRRWLRPFDHTAVRYVRRVQYGAWALATYGVLVLAAAALVRASARIIDNLLADSAVWNASYWVCEYAFSAAYGSAMVALLFVAASRLPRKLIVTEFGVVLKSFTYYSRTIPLESLDAVAVCRPHRLLSEPFKSRKVRPFHWSLWGKGLLLRLKDGTSYYLGFADAKQVQREFIRVWTKLKGKAPAGLATRPRRTVPPKLATASKIGNGSSG
jgi:hypothetical protein